MSFLSFTTRAVAVAAAAVLLAGSASAKTGSFDTNLRATNTASDSVLLSMSGANATAAFNVAGVQSFSSYGTAGNVVVNLNVGANAEVTGIGWDVIVSAIDPSWLSEMLVSFEDSTQTNGIYLGVGSGDDLPGLNAAYSSGGVVDLVGLGLNFQVGADGVLRLEFFEDFDDDSVSPDGIWNSGTLTINVATAVPEPATYGLMGLGLLAVVGAVRRRRTA